VICVLLLRYGRRDLLVFFRGKGIPNAERGGIDSEWPLILRDIQGPGSGLFLLETVYRELIGADIDLVAFAQHLLLDPLAIDKGAIGAAEILDEGAFVEGGDFCVNEADRFEWQVHGVASSPADGGDALFNDDAVY
jgi:hypothetical protein